jgi:hypothetical protein
LLISDHQYPFCTKTRELNCGDMRRAESLPAP